MKILLSVRKKGTGKEQLYLLIKQSLNNISLCSDQMYVGACEVI